MINTTTSTSQLTFAAPSLPDGMFTNTIVVMVSVLSRYGIGPSSDETAAITGKMMSNLHTILLLAICSIIVIHISI